MHVNVVMAGFTGSNTIRQGSLNLDMVLGLDETSMIAHGFDGVEECVDRSAPGPASLMACFRKSMMDCEITG